MLATDRICLALIALVWGWAWTVGHRWVRRSRVTEPAARWALAGVVPTAGLIFAVHLLALAALLSGFRLVTPLAVLPTFALLTALAHHLTKPVGWVIPAVGLGRRATPADSAISRRSRWICAPAAVVAAMYVIFVIDAATRYPNGYDAQAYHLPTAVRWAHVGSLDLIPGTSTHSYPNNGMIVPMLLASARLERILTVIHVPDAIILALLVHALSRRLGCRRPASILASCMALSVPVVAFQSFSAYVDLYAAVSWLSALLALMWASRTRQREQRAGLILLAGLSAGVALGAKLTYLALLPLLGIVVLLLRWTGIPSRNASQPRPAMGLALFVAAVLVCSGFWFIRGTVLTGNPIHPFAVEIAGHQLLPGLTADDIYPHRPWRDKLTHWLSYPWHERKYGAGYTYGMDNGLGAAFAAFVPAGLLCVTWLLLRRRAAIKARRWQLVCVALSLLALPLLLTVFHEILRFALPLVLLAVCVAAVAVDRWWTAHPRAVTTLITASLAVTAAIAVLRPAASFAGRVRDGDFSRCWFYQIPEMVDSLEPGTGILNLAGPHLNYPLLGRNLSNRVIDSDCWTALVHDEPLSTELLHHHGVDLVFVQDPPPDHWISDLRLRKIFDDSQTRRLTTTPITRIYRVPDMPVRPDGTLIPS